MEIGNRTWPGRSLSRSTACAPSPSRSSRPPKIASGPRRSQPPPGRRVVGADAPGPRLDHDLVPVRHELQDTLGREPDPILVVLISLGYTIRTAPLQSTRASHWAITVRHAGSGGSKRMRGETKPHLDTRIRLNPLSKYHALCRVGGEQGGGGGGGGPHNGRNTSAAGTHQRARRLIIWIGDSNVSKFC